MKKLLLEKIEIIKQVDSTWIASLKPAVQWIESSMYYTLEYVVRYNIILPYVYLYLCIETVYAVIPAKKGFDLGRHIVCESEWVVTLKIL